MNKKSAMAVAGGLVAALMSAVGAISVSVTGRAPAGAQPAHAAKPIVKTIRRTITIHRKPKHTAPPAVQIVTVPPATTLGPASAAPVTTTSGSLSTGHESEDDGHEDDHGRERGGDD